MSTAFLASSDFTGATFGDTVSFHSTEVSGTLAFPGAVFTAGADFNRVRGHQFDLPDKHGLLDLSDTVFEQRAHADLGTDFTCDGARFKAGLDLRLSGGRRASLRGVRFGAASTFSGVHRVDLDAEVTPGRDNEQPVPRPGAAWNVLQPRTRFRPKSPSDISTIHTGREVDGNISFAAFV